ncbi:MAG: hypothetical protein DDT22_00893 [candidate division WS2 bacterium]|nr:hypothetical protein [Candidatus Lithacetigena glycinireducens]
MGQEGEGHAKDINVFRFKQLHFRTSVRIDSLLHFVRCPPQAAPHYLLTQQLAAESAQAHDVRDRLGVPALGEHPHGNDLLDARPRLPGLAHRVHRPPQQLGLFGFGQLGTPLKRFGFFGLGVRFRRLRRRNRLFARFRLLQHLGVNVQDALRVAQLVNMDAPGVKGVLHPRRRLRPVADGDHHRRGGQMGIFPRLPCLAPVPAQEIIGVQHQVGQRFFRTGRTVQVVFYVRVVVDVVEARFVGLDGGHDVVAHHHARGLDQPRFDGVVQPKVADDPAEERLLAALLARRREGRGGKVVAGEDTPRTVQPVQPADPDRGLLGAVLHVPAAQVFAFRLPVDPPGVVRLVVDHQQVAGVSYLAQHLAGVGLVALDAALVHATPLPDLLLAVPGQGVPVAHQHLALAQFIQQRRRHNAERLVIIPLGRRFQHRQPAFHRQPWRDHQHVLGKAAVLRIGDLVQNLPGDEHGHNDSLARSSGHLTTLARKLSAVAGNLDADALGRRRFTQPDQRFHRFQLAEEETPRLELFRVTPVRKQPLGDAAYARPAGLAPGFHARADLVDQRDFHKDAGVVEGLGIARGHHIARRAAALHQVEGPRLARVAPVARRFFVGRVDDQAVDGCSGHHSTSRTFRLSMPRSSTILTAMRRCSPGAKGSETVPR